MRRYLLTVCFTTAALAATVPAAANAAVRINEISWMGTHKSSTAEWIELANTGTKTVSLAKWTLSALDGSPHIVFPSSAHISAHGYFLLERTRNGAVSGVTADLIYTGGLSNSGETLTLTNSASTTVDRVTPGKNWCLLGGNNKTKETAQRTAKGWITATGTPRAENTTTGTVPSCAKASTKDVKGSSSINTAAATAKAADTTAASESSATNNVSHDGGPSQYEPIPVVYLHIKASSTTVAGADMKFRAVATDPRGHLYPNAQVHFAFGDGSASNSTQMFKDYRVPGTYLVTATAIDGLGSGEDEMIVTVHRTSVRVTSVSPIGISLRNSSPYKLDLSYWELHAATTTFSFPEGTKMLPYTTVLFPYEITHLAYAPSSTSLWYPGGKVAVLYSASGAVVLTPQHRSSVVKLSTKTVGCNTVQGRCSTAHKDVHTNTLPAHVIAHENATVLAPAAQAKAYAAGALVDATQNTTHLATSTESASIATTHAANAASTVYNKGFFTPWRLSLIGTALALGIALVAL